MEESKPSSTWRGTALKWVGAITAVVSLVVAVQQLGSWAGDALQRRREAVTLIDVARKQADRGAYADAWATLDRAEQAGAGQAAEGARLRVAFAWLQEGRPGTGQTFTSMTGIITPALDRALVTATGAQRADVLAHLGWATFLRTRDGTPGDPAAPYNQALAIDPHNVFANTMLGHWLMWQGGSIDAARPKFDTALKGDVTKRPYVRRLQLAAVKNRGGGADAELLRVVTEMRRAAEPLDESMANYIYWAYSTEYRRGPKTATSTDGAPSAAEILATYDWVVPMSRSASGSPEITAFVRGVLQEAAGQPAMALATLRELRKRPSLPDTIGADVDAALKRLSQSR